MMKHGIPEDDLYTLVQPRLAELQLANNVHFNDQGYALLGNQVASSILMVLGRGTNGVLAAPSPSATSLPNAIVLPKDSEKDSRLKPDGKGWGLEEAVITDPTLPRVLLIGDSILGGYKKLVTTSLSGKANVDSWKNPNFQSEEFNKKLALVLEHGPYDVIHFNVGLHGWQKDRIKEGTYKPLTKELVELMKAKCPDAKLIWANTTPVTIKGDPSHLDPVINDIIVEHNRMASEVMQEENVPVEDFYGLLIGKLPLARGDQFHWQSGGYVILANAATASILQALPDSKKQ
jgi:lysophospholipase L1-like esterase